MTAKELFAGIGGIDAELVSAELPADKKPRRVRLRLAAAAAACLAAAILGVYFTSAGGRIELSRASHGAEVRYLRRAPRLAAPAADLAFLSEEELFFECGTAIFRGEIVGLDNIVIELGGEKFYRAVARISVSRALRGEFAAGDTVSLLLPAPVGTDVRTEDCGTTEAMSVGAEGIFMARPYTGEAFLECGGSRLALADIAECGLPDGERFAFISGGGSLVFSRAAYPSIENAASLDEIEDYIAGMIAR